jgi:hypothetical protein
MAVVEESRGGRLVRGCVVAGLAALAASALTVYAQHAGSTVLHACVNSASGTMRMTDGSGCRNGETPVSWNQAGPQGVAGPQGPQGLPGAQGAQGDQGLPGTAGISGAVMVVEASPSNDDAFKRLDPVCPDDKKALSGGWSRSGPVTPRVEFNNPDFLGLGTTGLGNSWHIGVTNLTGGTWTLFVWVVCAHVEA